MHSPVLLQEVVSALKITPGGLYIDATAGEGGHTLKIAELGGNVLGIDIDPEQIKNLELKTKNFKDIKLAQGNYSNIGEVAKKNGFGQIDGALFDLGLSMRQIKGSGQGFSYRNLEERLDMRLDRNLENTAESVINSFSVDELYEIFAKFSEEINSRAIAEAVGRARNLKRIERVGELIQVIDQVIGAKDQRVYSRIFQALRIVVNDELNNMRKGLKEAYGLLKNNGRIAILTFHSIEDRLVKQFIKENGLEVLNKKVIAGDRMLSYEKPAKLRVIVKRESIN